MKPYPDDMVFSLIDLTLLDDAADATALAQLAARATTHHVAAICVLPQHLSQTPICPSIRRATVVNFPTGQDDPKQVMHALDVLLIRTDVDEIDYVFCTQAYLSGQTQSALAQYRQVSQRCQQAGKALKVILETGYFTDLKQLYRLSREILEFECDFLKTSTGKMTEGATQPAVKKLLEAIRDADRPCGIKVSGGVHTLDQAYHFMQLAETELERTLDASWFRLGSSRLV